jgi:predicted O-linked N-acetylglucosamine transferase (SPINDLY family)
MARTQKDQAFALIAQRRWVEARDLLARICHRDKPDAETWAARMQVHLHLGESKDARDCGEHVLRLDPTAIDAMLNLGGLCAANGEFEQAEEYCRRAIRINPEFPGAYYNLGNALKAQARYADATDAYREALRLNPQYTEALINMANAHKEAGHYTEAVAACEQVLGIRPDSVKALHNLGSIRTAMGQVETAVACLRRAIQVDPAFTHAGSNLLLTLNYLPSLTPEESILEHRRWGAAVESSCPAVMPHGNPADPERRLRIGYMSPDLRGQHSVTSFIETLFAHHDRRAFEILAYAEVALPDATTARLRTLCDQWRTTCGKSDEEVAHEIRWDGIDILVDLAGHTANSRLTVFARKPAPIQVSYLGYPNTTGLSTIDFRLTDTFADPPAQTDRFHTEKLVRLAAGYLGYTPPGDAPDPGAPPMTQTGRVTFGSFNNIAKVGTGVVRVWAATMNALPESRILLKSHALSDTAVQDRFRQLFSDQGIAAHRVRLLGHVPDRAGHLAQYRDIDIALDPFPYNGTTTTCEALWMGVPVISLIGRAHAGRVGLSLLSHAGLVDLAASDEDDYRERALALARDAQRVSALRGTLRQRLLKSPLCRTGPFVRSVEHAYREMWRAWCASR